MLLLTLAAIAVLLPFILTTEQLPQIFSTPESPQIQQIRNRISHQEKILAAVPASLVKLKESRASNLHWCDAAAIDVDNARIRGVRRPDCTRLIDGWTDDAGLASTSMRNANNFIAALRRLDREIAEQEALGATAAAEIEASKKALGEAIAENEKARLGQFALALCLLRYGALGALGAIGFSIISKLGVFNRGQSAPVPSQTPAFFARSLYFVGTMIVGAILAVIFVPRLAEITNNELTAAGISIALAAGLVGDVALGAVRKIFDKATA